MPAWWSCATARRRRRGGSNASYGTTPRAASCATPTPATRTRSPAPDNTSSTCQVSLCDGVPQTERLLAPHSPPPAAAVHVDRVRGHEAACVRAHEQHELADLLGLAETLHRHVVQESLHQFRRGLRRGLERRPDRPRRDRETADTAVGEFARDAERHRYHRSL